MLNKEIKICKILTFSQEDFVSFSLEFATSGVDVSICEIKNYSADDFITIIVGWKNVKKLFPEHRISNKKIKDNIFWVYSIDEEKTTVISDTKKIIKNILSKWLPTIYLTYDCILDGKFSEFLNNNLNIPHKFYVYFSGKAMYLYNENDSDKIIGINLESMKYSGLDIKKSVTSFMIKYSPICLSYSNVSLFLNENLELNFKTIENIFWAKYNEEISEKNFYDFMMDVESDRFIPFLMQKLFEKQITNDSEEKYVNRLLKKDIITNWLSKRELFFNKNYANENIKFKKSKDNIPYTTLLYSNKRTITGRINCIDRRFNPQMLSRDGEERKVIISRFKNGKIVVFDYVSFETKIALFLSQDNEFIEKYKNKDLHEETAKVIFQKTIISSDERFLGKSINHTLIYGGGVEILNKHLKDLENKEEILLRVKEFLKPIIEKSEQIKISYEEIGFLTNSFNTIIRPLKSWASFSNFVSALAADMLVEKLFSIKDFTLETKSKFLFQVHDSFVFDFHPEELEKIKEIEKLLSDFNTIELQVKSSVGNNFSECGLKI